MGRSTVRAARFPVRHLRSVVGTGLVGTALLAGSLPAAATPAPVPAAPGSVAPVPAAAAGAGFAFPSEQQVADARAAALARAGDVGAIEGELTADRTALARADVRTEAAAEAYNGAVWRRDTALAAVARARRDLAAARAGAAREHGRLGGLAASAYRTGSGADGLTAITSARDPGQLLSTGGAVRAVAGGLDRARRAYRAAADRLSVEQARTDAALVAARSAETVASISAAAARAAESAQHARVTATAARRGDLIAALARARGTSVALATQRQAGLDEQARRVAAAAAAREAARREALRRAAAERAAAERAATVQAAAARSAAARAAAEAAGAAQAAREAAVQVDRARAAQVATTERARASSVVARDRAVARDEAQRKARDRDRTDVQVTPTPLAPPSSAPAPPSETTAPVNTPAPPVDTPAPPSDTPAPPSDTPAPPSDTPAPPSDTPTPVNTPAPPSGPPAPPVTVPDPPTTRVHRSSGAAAAMAYAEAKLGDPYVWGAAGPDSFDCSGLTMRAWEAGGVDLPHFASAQYSATRRVSSSDLQVGDLVFWSEDGTPGGIYHVALYYGNDKILAAPNSRTVVKIEGLYGPGTPTFFGRP